MKKITDFIINKRYLILVVFIIFSVISVILSNKVNINSDITKYLPNTSETRIGMDIMNEEFSDTEDSSSFNLMFKGLTEDKKQEVYNYLVNVSGVASVSYDNTENYNKEDATLFIVNVDDDKDSELSSNIYNEIIENYKDYDIYTSGEIANSNTEILPTWILVVAISSALIILIIACGSYVEPFLFLTTILMAVILNSGTNIIFDNVSSITSSISAILQMALSMDYSIMLMNRFRQEKQDEKDKVKAMKNALHNALKSISSSSLTTIVGLLALIFMSFTIGRDLGLVLAKGVLLSLICIFFVLPTLILIFDKLITKTQKKSFNISLNWLGNLSYKCRHFFTILFIIAFIVSYLLKGNLGILYTESELDEIGEVFGKNNQIAIIYKSENEEDISKHIKEIEQKEKVDEVLAYGNTINEKLNYSDLSKKLEDLGSDVTIEDYLIKIVYYKYYNPNEDNKMTFSELYNFIQNEVYTNEKLSNTFDIETKNNVNKLKYFTKNDEVNRKRTANEIANILDINKKNIDDILVYYNSKNNTLQLSINEFVKFMNNDVLTNSKYSKSIDQNTKKKLGELAKFSNTQIIQSKMTNSQIADTFGIEEDVITNLHMYYLSISEINQELELSEFTNFVITDILTNPDYSSSLDNEEVNSIKMLSMFSDKNVINKKMTPDELSVLFGIHEEYIEKLLLLNNIKEINCSPNEFVNLILKNSDNEIIKEFIDTKTMGKLQLLSVIMQSTINDVTYSYKELSTFIGMDENSLRNIYILYLSKNSSVQLSPLEFVNFVLEHKDDELLSGNFDTTTISTLQLLQTVMNGTVNNKKYNSQNLSKLLGIDKDSLDLLYGLYVSKYTTPNQTVSLNTFVKFILNDVIQNGDYSRSFDQNSKNKLQTINTIMNESLNGTKYTKDESFTILNNLTDKLDKDTIELLYVYYGSAKEYNDTWNLTVEQFVNFLNDNILSDIRFKEFIDDKMKEDIISSKNTIRDAKNLIVGNKYSRIIINTKLDAESKETFNFINDIKTMLEEDVSEKYVIGDSAMANEISKTFSQEFDFISVLTMIAIFIVVAITFKSIIVPLILVFIIQCAVYMTMGILSLAGGEVYFIAILIVQSILMGATIDYAIVYTSYYLEHREEFNVKDSIINSYNKSIHTILTSASILVIVTFIIGQFATEITAKICKTLAEGTLCSAILILILLPGILASCDRLIVKKK